KKLPPAWETLARTGDKDLKARLEKLGAERQKLLDEKTDLDLKGKTLPPEKAQRLLDVDFESDLIGLEQVLRRYEARPWEKAPKEEQRRQERSKLFRLVSYSAQLLL